MFRGADGGAAATVRVKVLLAVPARLVALTVMRYVPAMVGVPVRAPVWGLRVNPVGRVPPVRW